ncbi:hypothetical protein [Streptomyces sp. TS71-3]|uniref:hypothetical protein n=1 Tax=Streptomyces sp. TS71-3 TaxID=2733862 RepID=UPI0035ABC730
MDGAGVDKAALAHALGAPSGFGQSQFAFIRGHAFESRVKKDGGEELLRLVHRHLDPAAEPPTAATVRVPDLTAGGPEGRAARTALVLKESRTASGAEEADEEPDKDAVDGSQPGADRGDGSVPGEDRGDGSVPSAGQGDGSVPGADRGSDAVPGADPSDGSLPGEPGPPPAWTLLDHPMLTLDVAGTPAFLEPDALVVHPDGSWSVVEIKSFPMIDGSAEPEKVGAAARQAAVYVLALERLAQRLHPVPRVRHRVLLVCPKDFSNLPTAAPVDVRKQLAVTRRQLARLTRVEDIAATLPEDASFDVSLPPNELYSSVESVPSAYAPECLSTCEMAFHCRSRARAESAVTTLGRSVRGDLGGLSTVEAVLAAARGESGDPADPAVSALRRAAALRAEALEAGACR